ncbi:tetratricopeptide repeat protein 27-like [Lineus longissimus]|uniref:tetratricopeptide repeat protein 27-like n=1 Tax=Lineus longissimus TaxID=88925 RepID=UPI002B4F94F5
MDQEISWLKEKYVDLGEEVLTGKVCKSLLNGLKWTGQISDVGEKLFQNVRDYLDSSDDVYAGERDVLSVAIACLQMFVQNNWTGPPSEKNPLGFLPDDFIATSQVSNFNDGIESELGMDGECIYNLTRYPLYLYIAEMILSAGLQCFKHCQTHEWWIMRCAQLHQSLLQVRSPLLKAQFMDLRTKVLKLEPELLKFSLSVAVEFHIEAAHQCLFYFEYAKAREHLARAAELAGLEIDLTGAPGKRTKFQEKSLAQLVVRTTRRKCDRDTAPEEQTKPRSLPKDIPLDNDVLLPMMKIEEGHEVPQEKLKDYEQSLMLAICLEHKKMQAGSELLDDEMNAYLDYILSNAQSWPVTGHALFMRSILQKTSFKRILRTLAQVEELVAQFRADDTNPLERQHMFFSSALPTSWYTERELGYVQVSVGSTKTALELFLRLQLWSSVIECYQVLGRREKAEKVIREQLAIKETADLYCYLGDVTHDLQHYEKAWEMSKRRSSRAQKHWGLHLFSEGKTKEAIDHLEQCLNLNPLQEELWFTYGCACMGEGELKKAIAGFRRSVGIEPDSFQSWNNLAACLIKDDQKVAAFRILGEAIKCKFDSWRLWENYLLIGIDIGNFEQGIRAYSKMLDLKDRYTDIQLLTILVRAVNEDIPNVEDKPSAPLRPKLLELFGKITSKVTSDAGVWQQYAKLIGHEDTEENNVRVIQYLQKALRCMIQTDEWLKDIEKSKNVAQEAASIADAYLEFAQKSSNTAQVFQFLCSARLSLNSVETQLRQKHRDTLGELLPEIVESCDTVTSKLNTIIEKIDELNS